MAVGAFDVLKNSEVYQSLSDALKDVGYAIGTSCAKQRDIEPVRIRNCIDRICQLHVTNRVAIVFGDERNGLLTDELQRCHQIAMIPVNPEFPSLNVAQAVGIFAYEVASSLFMPSHSGSPDVSLSDGHADDELFTQIDALPNNVQFTRSYNRQNIICELRSVYQRSLPSARECEILRGAIRKINQQLANAEKYGQID